MGYIEALRPDIHVYFAAETNGDGGNHDKSEHGGKKGKQRGGQRVGKEGKPPQHE